MTLLGYDKNAAPTSEWISGSVGTNAVVIRNIIGQLKRAGLVTTSQGIAGTRLATNLDSVTLLDVYRAVEVDANLFSVHSRPNPACPVGNTIQQSLEGVLDEAQRALEVQLSRTTVADILSEVTVRSC